MKKTKLISLFLILCLIFTCIQIPAFATQSENGEVTTQQTSQVTTYTENDILSQDDVSKYINYENAVDYGHVALLDQTSDTLTYLNYDNTQTTYFFGMDIAYENDNGSFIEKDITLELKENISAYKTKANNIETVLPQNISQGISLSHEGKTVELTPISISLNEGNTKNVLQAANTTFNSVSSVAALNADENQVSYSTPFGANTSLVYTPLLNGVKEDIILSQYNGVTEFPFILETNGMGVFYDEAGEFYYTASAEGEKDGFVIGKIYVYDNDLKVDIGSITISPITVNEKYLLTVCVNEDFLTDEETTYPVTIDPSFTINSTSYIEDAITYTNYPNNNYGGYQYAYIGNYGNYGIGRLLVRFPILSTNVFWESIASSADINFARYYMYCGTSSAASSIQPNLYWGNTWTESSVKNSNINWAEVYPHSMPATTISTTAGFYLFDVTGTVKSWKDGMASPALGFVFTNTDTSNTSKVKCFRTKEYATAHGGSTMPYLLVNYYTSTPPLPSTFPEAPNLISGERYYIKNKNSGQYLFVKDGTDANGTAVVQERLGVNNLATAWKLVHVGDGIYKLVTELGSKTRVLDVSGGSNENEVPMCIHDDGDVANRRFRIILNSDGYSYRIASQNSNFEKAVVVQYNSCERQEAVIQHTYENPNTCNDEWLFEPVDNFSVDLAVNYATKNYNSHVPTYPLLEEGTWEGGADCANFVSQCMLAGGVHFQDEWWIYKENIYHSVPQNVTELNDSWDFDDSYYGNLLHGNKSSPWFSAPKFGDFWESKVETQIYSGKEIKENPNKIYELDFEPGDVIQKVSKFSGAATHTMFITKKENGTYFLTYHNTNTINRSLADILEDDENVEYKYRFFKMK